MATERTPQPIDARWFVLGRYAAWVCGLSFAMPLILFILAEIGIFQVPPPPPGGRGDPVEYLTYAERIGPFRQLGAGFWLLGVLALAPIGFSLRRHFGKGPASNLMTAAFAGSTVAGVVWTLAYIGGVGAVMRAAAETPAEMAAQLVLIEQYVWQTMDAVLLSGTLLLMGIGALLAGALSWTTTPPSRGWGVLSLMLGIMLLTSVIGFGPGFRNLFFLVLGD